MGKKHQRFILHKNFQKKLIIMVTVLLLLLLITPVSAKESTQDKGEELYTRLSQAATDGDSDFLSRLAMLGEKADWTNASEISFDGNLRLLSVTGQEKGQYLVRNLDGSLYLLSIPLTPDTEAVYDGIDKMTGDKLEFVGLLTSADLDGESYTFIRFTKAPNQLLLDRVFKVATVFMFFFIMLGMGMNLTFQEFMLVFKKPKGIIIGIILQWLVMPFMALGIAYIFGYYQHYPFIYAGMILICACPGGVTSNLMTYYAKGDLALSVSLTSISTVLSLLFTPLILTAFCNNIPNVKVPADLIVQTITLLVLVPLILGLLIRRKWEKFSKKVTPFFSALGVFALAMIIGVGLYTNFEKLADTQRYSALFYVMVILLSLLGMLGTLGLAKLLRLNNPQARAISVEVGCRNSTLAVTLALLIQDLMGDYFSSMFVTTAIYGITMYPICFLMIALFKYLLPIKTQDSVQSPSKTVS